MTAARTAAERRAEFDAWLRFRPYAVTKDGTQIWLACAGCATLEAIGPMLQQLLDDGEYGPRDAVGVLDTGPWTTGAPARWLINPHHAKETP